MAVRIHELAKELNMDNKELIELLKGRGFAVKSVSSTVDNISAESLRSEFAKKESSKPVAEVKAAESVKPVFAGGAMVRSAEDIAKERAARAEEQKPKVFAPPSIPGRPTPPPMVRMPSTPPPAPVRSSFAPPAIPQRPAGLTPAVPAMTKPAGAPPSLPPIVRMPTPPPAVTRPGMPLTPPAVKPAVADVPGGTAASVPSAAPGELKILQVKPPIVVRDFALMLGQKPFKLISSLMEMGIFASMNQILEPELAIKIAEKFGVLLEIKQRGDAKNIELPKKKEAPKVDEATLMKPRPPVVCILGHVDHGKTTLIDYIRKTNVVAGEAGGITQHIGAYQITVNDKQITFLDTPGHSAFEKMRARGASLTDIAVLVIAADDGFKPQTDEALKHCRKAGVPIVVAINKIDVKGANIDRVKKQMQERNLLPEDWGGETITVGVSAIKGENVDSLLEMILLQAEVLELKANPGAPAEGQVVESKIEVGRGPTATVIVQKGTLKAGDAIVCGGSCCKVRSLLNERDEKLDKAPPSTPVRIIGWSEAPEVGGNFTTAKNEREAKAQAEATADEILKIKRAQQKTDVPTNAQEFLASITAQTGKILTVVVKADVMGSLEAVVDALNNIKSDKVKINIVESSVGQITTSDVERAHIAKATILAFSTRQENGVSAALKHTAVPVISHNIIYELVDQVKEAMTDLLDPILQERVLGKGNIIQLFALTKGHIAGTMVTEGSIFRDKLVRVTRGKDLIGQGKISQLKRVKDDVAEVRTGFDCGILFQGFEGYQVGDTVECYEITKIKAQL